MTNALLKVEFGFKSNENDFLKIAVMPETTANSETTTRDLKRQKNSSDHSDNKNLGSVISQINGASMHISKANRDYLISRFNEILSPSNQSEDDFSIDLGSLNSLLNLLSFKNNLQEFYITVTPDGALLGSWYTIKDNVHILFVRDKNYLAACNRKDVFGGEETLINKGSLLSLLNFMKKHDIMIEQ